MNIMYLFNSRLYLNRASMENLIDTQCTFKYLCILFVHWQKSISKSESFFNSCPWQKIIHLFFKTNEMVVAPGSSVASKSSKTMWMGSVKLPDTEKIKFANSEKKSCTCINWND